MVFCWGLGCFLGLLGFRVYGFGDLGFRVVLRLRLFGGSRKAPHALYCV